MHKKPPSSVDTVSSRSMSSWRRPIVVAVSALVVLGCNDIKSPEPEKHNVFAVSEGNPFPDPADMKRELGTPPGAIPFTESEAQQLWTAMMAETEPPRTRHKWADGKPKFTNKLVLESSPYLRQHAHNPVNWMPWGDEAFALAKELDRPVFLSVGYSTCHWCHVMEEESFEDLEIAEYLNKHYISIKVDREERPDVDDVYMKAVYALNGRGGWPMTVIMTPDRKPFFGATYIPPRAGARGSETGFIELLTDVAERYQTDRKTLIDEAEKISKRMAQRAQPRPPGNVPTTSAIQATAEKYLDNFDRADGGFGRAPKFPQPSILMLMMRAYRRSGDEEILNAVEVTLEKMFYGGMYDHVAGGFHRYSTDKKWLVPHFEKMLYDNAQLTLSYLEGYQLTGRDDFAFVANDILTYVLREMTSPTGGFYSATDADAGGEEGTYFTWTPAELSEILTEDELRLVTAHYGVKPGGNFEGRNILHMNAPLAKHAKSLRISDPIRVWESAREKLYQAREKRIKPGLDDKILTSWNGLMIGAFARSSMVFNEPKYLAAATKAADEIMAKAWVDGRLYRRMKNGDVGILGYLDDYANFQSGLLELYEASSDPKYLDLAIDLQSVVDELFIDEKNGGYFFSSTEHESLLVREKPSYDGAEPSGNSVISLNLLKLAELTGDPVYKDKAYAIFAAFGTSLARGSSQTYMLSALDFALDTVREIVIVKPDASASSGPLDKVLYELFLPNRVVVRTVQGEELAETQKRIPWVEDKHAMNDHVTAYVCESGRCELPTSDPRVFARQISKVTPYRDNDKGREPHGHEHK